MDVSFWMSVADSYTSLIIIPQSDNHPQLERSFISKMASCLHIQYRLTAMAVPPNMGFLRWKIVENTNNASRNMVNHKHNVPHEGSP